MTHDWSDAEKAEDCPSPAIEYTTERVKPSAELRASDVPRGLDLDDLATDL